MLNKNAVHVAELEIHPHVKKDISIKKERKHALLISKMKGKSHHCRGQGQATPLCAIDMQIISELKTIKDAEKDFSLSASRYTKRIQMEHLLWEESCHHR